MSKSFDKRFKRKTISRNGEVTGYRKGIDVLLADDYEEIASASDCKVNNYSGGVVSRGMHLQGGLFSTCPIKEATHFFVGVSNGYAPHGSVVQPLAFPVAGTTVDTISVKIGGKRRAHYAKTTTFMVGASRRLLAYAAYAYTGVKRFYYNAPEIKQNLGLSLEHNDKDRIVLTCRNVRIINTYMTREFKRTKVSGEHHIHYTVREVMSAISVQKKPTMWGPMLRIIKWDDLTESAVAGILLWLHSIPDEMAKYVETSEMWKADSLADWAARAKRYSNLMKIQQRLIGLDLRPLFEMDVLINRGVGQVDWNAEMENRTRPNVVKVSPRDVYKAARQVFGDEIKLKPQKVEWDKYWASRWQFTPTGSVHTQYAADLPYIEKEREFKNKLITMLQIDRPLDEWLARTPEIQAWSSVKYEWGKMRAIYGTDLTSFVLTNFAMYKCEEVLPYYFPVGSKARDDYVSLSTSYTLHQRLPYCFDFEDFNSQHSSGAMQAVLTAYRDAYRYEITPEQLKALDWVINSFGKMQINDNYGGMTYRAQGTLLSGHRLTTFINSVLNRVYLKMIMPDDIEAIHNGDDALVGVMTMSDVLHMDRKCDQFNIRKQRTKCYPFGMAEFLRVDHSDGSGGQYIARAIATLMHARTESNVPSTVIDSIESNENRLKEAFERGMIASRFMLRRCYEASMCRTYNIRPGDYAVIINTHRAVGGLSIEVTARYDKKITIDKSIGRIKPEFKNPLRGVGDYAARVKHILGDHGDIEEISKRVMNATIDTVTYVRRPVIIEENDKLSLSRIKIGLYKMFSRYAKSAVLGHAKLAGIAMDVLIQGQDYAPLKHFLDSVDDNKRKRTWIKILI